jgi:hypothetical protein
MLRLHLKGFSSQEPVSIPDSPDNTRNRNGIFPDDTGNGYYFELNHHTAPKHE